MRRLWIVGDGLGYGMENEERWAGNKAMRGSLLLRERDRESSVIMRRL